MEFTTENLAGFRWMVAGYVKHLIIARWKSEPGFLSEEELASWELMKIATDRLASATHIRLASNDLYRINTEFLSRCGSGGLAINEAESVIGELISAVAFLVSPAGGAPGHNAALLQVAATLEEGGTFDWNALVNWDQLPCIREGLDRLPRRDQNENGPTADGIRLDGQSYWHTSLLKFAGF